MYEYGIFLQCNVRVRYISQCNVRVRYIAAGSVMYEYGMRLGQETTGLKSLQKQAKCYLAALNALRLVDPAYAWIVKPATAQQVRVVAVGLTLQVSFT